MVTTIIYLILFIVSNILGIISGFLPVGFSTIMFAFMYLVFITCAFSLLLVIIILSTQKKFNYVHVIILALFIIDIGGYYYFYNLERGYNEVNNYMKNNYSDYKIIGIKEAFLEQRDPEDIYGSFASCNYVFDVKINDNTNNVFQAGYCNLPGIFPVYEVVDTYDDKYIKYYLKEYNKENNSSLKLELDDNYFLYNSVILHFNNTNYKELFDFIKYLQLKDKHRFNILLKNDDIDREYYYNRNDYHEFDIVDDIEKLDS